MWIDAVAGERVSLIDRHWRWRGSLAGFCDAYTGDDSTPTAFTSGESGERNNFGGEEAVFYIERKVFESRSSQMRDLAELGVVLNLNPHPFKT